MYAETVKFPKMARVKQIIAQSAIKDIRSAVSEEVKRINIADLIKPGEKVGITVGSRGIANLKVIVEALIEEVKQVGGEPFILPAMGSHGGGTAEGQIEMLKSLGISSETMNVPVIACGEATQIGTTQQGIPVYVNEITRSEKLDKIIIFNRVKEHTEFEGDIESGIHKICAIGIGNPQGALTVHQYSLDFGYEKAITEVGAYIIKHLPVAFAFASVENYYHKTAHIKAMLPDEIADEEKKLLKLAKSSLGKIPFEELDVLIIDEMGKNVSGSGMDTNVIGRILVFGQKEPEKPVIKRIVVLDTTEESHGMATGIGLADFTTKKLVDKLDLWSTYFNCITAQAPEKGRLPIYFVTEKDSIGAALTCIGITKSENARVVHIRNTNEVEVIEVSESLVQEVLDRSNLQLLEELKPMQFDEAGNILRILK
ncbi:lactate racemase domain-containing protein [Sporomusa sp.]|uniref:lactate racemase domain-containing protein n=1 Tax=Sporomusa sp. TaxID=2078658 RepID=UPI002CDEEAAF|nr:lactate racemase domain-containing protein [Sporomusa sp.]HWR05792.1 lactate racemase domain-containing protein [Sporomusa sp.]